MQIALVWMLNSIGNMIADAIGGVSEILARYVGPMAFYRNSFSTAFAAAVVVATVIALAMLRKEFGEPKTSQRRSAVIATVIVGVAAALSTLSFLVGSVDFGVRVTLGIGLWIIIGLICVIQLLLFSSLLTTWYWLTKSVSFIWPWFGLALIAATWMFGLDIAHLVT
ncbi:hypothetical protein ACFQ30_20005, partial [Devosia equisanguinis]|uniref:hypothetical protein n=1 Tax=Devosia equisanguinis TaxID=2490941 RepID=UPI00363A14E5